MKTPDFFRQAENRHTLRAAILIGLATLIYVLTGLKHGYWLSLTVIILIQSNIGATIKRSWERVLGTFSGVMLGVVLAMLIGHSLVTIILLALLILFISIYVFIFSYTWALFGVSTMIVMVVSLTHLGAVDAAFYRLLDTMLGAVLVILGSLLLWPDHARTILRDSYRTTLKESSTLLTDLLFTNTDLKTSEKALLTLQNQINSSRTSFSAFSYEMNTFLLTQNSILAGLLSVERLFSVLISIKNLLNTDREKVKSILEKKELRIFCELTCEQVEKLIHTELENIPELEFNPAKEALEKLRKDINPALTHSPVAHLLIHNLEAYLRELTHIYYATVQARRYVNNQRG